MNYAERSYMTLCLYFIKTFVTASIVSDNVCLFIGHSGGDRYLL